MHLHEYKTYALRFDKEVHHLKVSTWERWSQFEIVEYYTYSKCSMDKQIQVHQTG
jgi:hypothetical protein